MIIVKSCFDRWREKIASARKLGGARITGSMSSPDSLPLRDGDFGFGPVQNLLEFGNAVAHARMHVSFRALDVIVQIITEKLNVGNGGRGHIRIGEVSGE